MWGFDVLCTANVRQSRGARRIKTGRSIDKIFVQRENQRGTDRIEPDTYYAVIIYSVSRVTLHKFDLVTRKHFHMALQEDDNWEYIIKAAI